MGLRDVTRPQAAKFHQMRFERTKRHADLSIAHVGPVLHRVVVGIRTRELARDLEGRGYPSPAGMGWTHKAVTRLLIGSGWEVAPEVSFNHYGERGVIDLVAWHPAARTLLIVELKTEIVDVNELLGVMDRRCRIAPQAVRERGWVAHDTSAWIIVAESRTNRRRIAEFRSVLRAAFPEDGRTVAGWLCRPTRQQRALWILPDARSGTLGRNSAPIKRVRTRAPSVLAGQSQ